MIDIFAEQLQVDSSIISYTPVGGGSINDTYKLHVGNRQLFCKVNLASRFPEMFAKEQRALHKLMSTGIIRVPVVEEVFVAGDHQFLLMEFVDQGKPSDSFWQRFGEQLAALHCVNETYCGLNEDNFMGSVQQSNNCSGSWPDFFITQRIAPQIKLAADRKLLPPLLKTRLENLYKRIPSIFPEEKFSLLHGDLWSGNFLCDAQAQPVLIDPALYFGSRHMDLAMTTLFGGFSHRFYESYRYHFPYPANSEEIWDLCNIYPLLVHVNLFGPSYLSSIRKILERF